MYVAPGAIALLANRTRSAPLAPKCPVCKGRGCDAAQHEEEEEGA